MAIEAPDYIRELNRLGDELFRDHNDLLARKNICRKTELMRVIKLDLDKLTHALFEVKESGVPDLLRRFFAEPGRGPGVDCGRIRERLTGQRIDHVGFEIHEPMGLVLQGIHHWIEQSKRALGANMRIRNYLRFPASPAFQKRVGAEAEIMRIWVEVNGQALMLELFDIYRPVDPALATAPRTTHRNFHGLFRRDGSVVSHGQRITRLFAEDEIWHYAFQVRGPEDVTALHGEWQRLVETDSSYFLPYTAPVWNEHDRSFHTKIIRSGGTRLELEFVTQLPAG